MVEQYFTTDRCYAVWPLFTPIKEEDYIDVDIKKEIIQIIGLTTLSKKKDMKIKDRYQ
jgi:hypothetical protein